MIEILKTPNPDILAFEAVGTLSKEDYDKVLGAEIKKAYEKGNKIRFLYLFGDRFKGFSPGAAWEDCKIGLRYLKIFERCAVVTDKAWIRHMSGFIGSLLPCPVRAYKNSEYDEAMAWLNSGSIGLDHRLEKSKGILFINIESSLTSDNFELISETVDPWIEEGNQLNGILIHVKKFPGWENLGSFISHIQFIKDHHKKVNKIAICADGVMASVLPKLGSHFIKAEVRHFDFDALEEATKWLEKN